MGLGRHRRAPPEDAESGVPAADLLRKHGVSKATFFESLRNPCVRLSASEQRIGRLELVRVDGVPLFRG